MAPAVAAAPTTLPVVTEPLPLFPLATVLFPGLVLPLHIFEDRYRLLVRDLLDRPPGAARQFGVVAIRSGTEVGPGPPALHEIGCTAELRRAEPYDDGRFDIVTTGGSRFRLRNLDTTGVYLTGAIELLTEETGDADAATPLSDRVRAAFAAYLRALGTAQGSELTLPDLPAEPGALSYLVAAAIVVDLPDKQRLLAASDAVDRLRLELALLLQETRLLRALAAAPAVDLGRQSFSAN